MLPKYTVEYTVELAKHAQRSHYGTDDPVACEEFLAELLERGIRSLARNSIALSPAVAASRIYLNMETQL